MTEEHKKRESKHTVEVHAGSSEKQNPSVESEEILSADALSAELEKTRCQCQEYFEGWQRERADFANYKKRIERDQMQLSQSVNGTIIKKYLVIIDDLERALKNRPVDSEGAKWAEGIDLIYRKLQTILESESVKRIPAESAEFDPTIHEAISHEESPDHESGQVIEVLQQGYMIGDRVLRPALVRVAK
jgi:molecular chaperone GrpE